MPKPTQEPVAPATAVYYLTAVICPHDGCSEELAVATALPPPARPFTLSCPICLRRFHSGIVRWEACESADYETADIQIDRMVH